jgi:hypothetical protein
MPEQTLSPLAWNLREATAETYSKLVVSGGTPAAAAELLASVKPEQLLTSKPISPAYTQALLAALWLWHDGLDECHRIVQQSTDGPATPTYSFWHAIMHRREGDFSNSKYWYARAGSHPIVASLKAKAGTIINRAPADKTLLRLTNGEWDPNLFVDFTESLADDQTNPFYEVAVELQRMEWLALFEYCSALA